MTTAPITANATFCATLSDQWASDGLRAAFIAPGSRSTPLALALLAQPQIDVHIFHDERSASFAALGWSLANDRPAIVLCSSGTAGAHFYAAVIEADASAVPLIVVTADRPPELWNRGAPQTIDQTDLYGHRVNAFYEPGPPDDGDPATWRDLARSVWVATVTPRPGPVHMNLSFRDPLTGIAGELAPRLPDLEVASPAAPDPAIVDEVTSAMIAGKRGVIVAGRNESAPAQILELARLLDWPLLADHRSGCRDPESTQVIRHFDALLRASSFADDNIPDVVVRIGEILSSKALSQWLASAAQKGATVISSRPHGRHIDPEDIATVQFDEHGMIDAVLSRLGAQPQAGAFTQPAASEAGAGTGDTASWLSRWRNADAVAAAAIAATLDDVDLSEVAVAQSALASIPAGGALVVASSMPVRDVEWYGPHRNDIDVISNRGANGIDGIVATAVGVALTGRATTCLIGDVAFLHDASSLTALADRALDLTIVVTDNDGGGIFSFLPQHSLLPSVTFEELFGTPHGVDITALAQAYGIDVEAFNSDLTYRPGVRIVHARTDRASNLALHDSLNANVAAALATGTF